MCVNISIFTWAKWDGSWHIWEGGGGGAYNRMHVLFTGRRAYSGGGGMGGAMADPDRQVRGGDGHSVPEKKGMEPFQKKNFRPQFGLKLRRGGGCSGSSPGSATEGML